MGWRRLDLLDTQDKDLDPIWRTAWSVMYADSPADAKNAVFRRDGEPPCMYFSPAAQELGETFGADECEEPAPEGLHLVAGEPGAWDACFPGVPQPTPAQGKAPSTAATPAAAEDFQPTIPSDFDPSYRPTIPSVL